MKKYKSHKTVEAVKIKDILHSLNAPNDWHKFLIMAEDDSQPITVSQEYIDRYTPLKGGYYVRYANGYESFSPAEAFEDGYMLASDAPLNFEEFRKANKKRANKWHPEGIDSWSLSDWAVAVMGELGELCSDIKCLNRSRDGLVGNKKTDEELRKSIPKEIADIFIYLDLLAEAAGVNLGEAVRQKFNEVSERNGFDDRL